MLKISIIIIFISLSSLAPADECVLLLHGLARTGSSMSVIQDAFIQQGYRVVNSDYSSRHQPIEVLAEQALGQGIAACQKTDTAPQAATEPQPVSINIVTHSLGGILVRQYFSHHSVRMIRRVVMLGPPNQGSQVVDHLKNVPGFSWINGPAGMQLGTDSKSVPAQLGPVNFELGIIAGTETFNPLLSLYLPNPDDGKVSLDNTKVKGMCAFLAMPVTHTFMMRNKQVIAETLAFIQTGKFISSRAEYFSDCTRAADRRGGRS